jgi:hypothetical protein
MKKTLHKWTNIGNTTGRTSPIFVRDYFSSYTTKPASVITYTWSAFYINLTCIKRPLFYVTVFQWSFAGADPGFQVRGAYLKKLRRILGGRARAGCAPWIHPCFGRPPKTSFTVLYYTINDLLSLSYIMTKFTEMRQLAI